MTGRGQHILPGDGPLFPEMPLPPEFPPDEDRQMMNTTDPNAHLRTRPWTDIARDAEVALTVAADAIRDARQTLGGSSSAPVGIGRLPEAANANLRAAYSAAHAVQHVLDQALANLRRAANELASPEEDRT